MNKLARTAHYSRFWTSNYLRMGRMITKAGLFKTYRDLQQYPWMKVLLQANLLHDKFGKNREGRHLEATSQVVSYVIKSFADLLYETLNNDDRLIIHEDMVPPEIFRAMGLAPFMAELLGIALPLILPHSVEEYIDRSESFGVPPDICSLPKSTMGFALAEQMPPANALITSNLPCDGGMASYVVMERQLNLPTFRLDIPHNFYNDRARDYFTGEMYRLIDWLEDHTCGKMDWDRLAAICRERNKMVDYELELWDMIKHRPSPMAGEPVWLSHLWGANVNPESEKTSRLFQKLVELTRQNLSEGRPALKEEKFRALLWNPPLLHVSDLFNWAETAYGVSLIMDSMSYNRREPYIDTSSEESMLRGLGQNIMEGPMARHTRGPSANYIEDIFVMIKQFDIDMLWVAGHVGCKNTAALNGMLRERCREAGVPMLIINYDLSDPRVASRDAILEQINHFMENIMKARRQDL
ncbi:MAG: 2-hydroxyacyl-CoA dehydratase subunit D [Desulfosudaceae bacterium]